MKRKLLVFGFVFLAFLIFLAMSTVITIKPVLAAVNDTVIIDVNVTEAASITVWPTTLNWTGAATGQAAGEEDLTVKNAGSLNVSGVYAYVDTLITEPIRPYQSPNPKDFSAGSVITIRNETDTKFYFAGRLEWNWTQEIPNNDWSAVTTPVAWGYFRNTSDDYVWVLGNGTDNCTDGQFAIENQTDLGTTATRTPLGPYTIIGSSDLNWGYTFITDSTSPLYGHCVAAYYDCQKIFIYKYDRRSSFTGCTDTAYLYEGNLTPGVTFIIKADAWVPNGIPNGFLNTTTLTVIVSSPSS